MPTKDYEVMKRYCINVASVLILLLLGPAFMLLLTGNVLAQSDPVMMGIDLGVIPPPSPPPGPNYEWTYYNSTGLYGSGKALGSGELTAESAQQGYCHMTSWDPAIMDPNAVKSCAIANLGPAFWWYDDVGDVFLQLAMGPFSTTEGQAYEAMCNFRKPQSSTYRLSDPPDLDAIPVYTIVKMHPNHGYADDFINLQLDINGWTKEMSVSDQHDIYSSGGYMNFVFPYTSDVVITYDFDLSIYGDVGYYLSQFNIYIVSVGWSPTEQKELRIPQAKIGKDQYCLDEMVEITCLVKDNEGEMVWDAKVKARIDKPNGLAKIVELFPNGEYYKGLFTPAPEDGAGEYKVMIWAEKDDYIGGTYFGLSFEVVSSDMIIMVWHVGIAIGQAPLIIPDPFAKVTITKDGHIFPPGLTDSQGLYHLNSILPGMYTVEVEGGINGRYIRQVDVPPCGDVMVEIPAPFRNVQKQNWKTKALKAHSTLLSNYVYITEVYESVMLAINVYSAYSFVHGYSSLLNTAQTEALGIGLIPSSLEGTRFMQKYVLEYVILDRLTGAIGDIEVDIIKSYETAARREIDVLINIINDPPNMEYTEILELQIPEEVFLPPEYDGGLTPIIVSLANGMAKHNAIEEALLGTFERYQGALAAGEAEFISLQAEVMMLYASLLMENSEEIRMDADSVKSEIDFLYTDVGPFIQELQERLSIEGFTFEEQQSLESIGLIGEDLESYRQFIISFDISRVFEGLDDLGAFAQNRAEFASVLLSQVSEVLSFLLADGVTTEPITPLSTKQGVLASLNALFPTDDKKLDHGIGVAIEHVEKSLASDLWETDWVLTMKGKKVFDEEKKAVHELMKLKDAPSAIVDAIGSFVATDEQLAQTAIDLAISLGGDEKEIIKAEEDMTKAVEELNKDKPNKAIDHYKKAWEHAQKAMKNIPEPGDDLCAGRVKPQKLTMEYTGEGAVALHSQDPKQVSVVGDPNSAPTVYIIANNKKTPDDPKAKVWFEGAINLGETFDIDAANGEENHLKTNTYVHVHVSDASGILQTVKFHTSCSQPLREGDQFGSLVLLEFIPYESSNPAPTLSSSSGFGAPSPYPQPCNPEVWIPYKLAKDVEVNITIYDSSGRLIRTLDMGYRPVGAYITKDKAAYWNGKNEAGEQVSSGVYFYTIQAGEFIATRKMVVGK